MDGLITRIQESAEFGSLNQYLKSQQNLLNSNVGVILNAVQTLDPARHALGYLYLLEARAAGAVLGADTGRFLKLTSRLLKNCGADQIQQAPDRLVSLCRVFKDTCITVGEPKRAVAPLLAALRKLQPSKGCLTPIHADLFQACLLCKTYNAVEDVLLEDIFDVEPSSATPRDLQLYCLYGGMLLTGRKMYQRALELFMIGLTAPTMVVNAITMAIYKKYVLVSLIHRGRVDNLPKFVPNMVTKGIKSDCDVYTQLHQTFLKSSNELQQFLDTNQQVFHADNNSGLIQLVVESHRQRRVHQLTQTYLTLSLTDIAQAVGLGNAAEAELYVLRMIDDGEIFAEISEKDGMVCFLEDPEEYKSHHTTQRLDALFQQSIQLAEKIQAYDRLVSSDKQYLSKITMKERHSRYEETADLVSEAEAAATFAFKS